MKVIRANDVAISTNAQLPGRENARELAKRLIKIKDDDIHFVKAETEDALIPGSMHPFVEAVHLAYGEHLPLVISPDMIWYLISSGVARHINANAESLRSKFVDHEGKQRITVKRGHFEKGSPNSPWPDVIEEFCTKLGALTKTEVAELMQAKFSTTTTESRIVSQIVLMDSMQKYFEFFFSTICGIPEIRVSGTKEDWARILDNTHKLVAIIPELKRWLDSGLAEILDHFVKIFDGHEDKAFWNEIYKVNGGSGGPYVTGWILALFPYIKDGEKNRYVWEDNSSWRDSTSGDFFSGLTTNSFDYHMNQVPFSWDGTEMLFAGGLLGVSVGTDHALTPIFGYAITEDKVERGQPEGPQ